MILALTFRLNVVPTLGFKIHVKAVRCCPTDKYWILCILMSPTKKCSAAVATNSSIMRRMFSTFWCYKTRYMFIIWCNSWQIIIWPKNLNILSQVFQYLSCKYFEYLFHHRLDINRPFVVWRDLPPSFLVLNAKRLFESNSRLSSRLKLGKCNDRVRCNFTIIVRRFWWLFKHFYFESYLSILDYIFIQTACSKILMLPLHVSHEPV